MFSSETEELLSRALGRSDSWVHLRFALSDEDATKDGPFYEIYVRVSPCGEARGERGTSLTLDEYGKTSGRER
jgi:hypothetical protein